MMRSLTNLNPASGTRDNFISLIGGILRLEIISKARLASGKRWVDITSFCPCDEGEQFAPIILFTGPCLFDPFGASQKDGKIEQQYL